MATHGLSMETSWDHANAAEHRRTASRVRVAVSWAVHMVGREEHARLHTGRRCNSMDAGRSSIATHGYRDGSTRGREGRSGGGAAGGFLVGWLRTESFFRARVRAPMADGQRTHG